MDKKEQEQQEGSKYSGIIYLLIIVALMVGFFMITFKEKPKKVEVNTETGASVQEPLRK